MQLQDQLRQCGEAVNDGQFSLGIDTGADKPNEGLIVHPADIERMCRISVRQGRRQSPLGIRVALAASMRHGCGWFPVIETLRELRSGRSEQGGLVASRLQALGVAETRYFHVGGYRRADARLNLQLVDIDHFHGRQSRQLMNDFEVYFRLNPKATPLAAILLVAIRVYGVQSSNDLAKYLEPDFDRERSPCAASKTLKTIADAGLVTIVRDGKGASRPFFVLPNDHAF